MTAPYFRRGFKAKKADTLQRSLCHIDAKSAEMIILPLSRDYGSICLKFCKKYKGQKWDVEVYGAYVHREKLGVHKILNALFRLTCLSAQQYPHPTDIETELAQTQFSCLGRKTHTWSIFIFTPHCEIILFGSIELNSHCLVHIPPRYNWLVK